MPGPRSIALLVPVVVVAATLVAATSAVHESQGGGSHLRAVESGARGAAERSSAARAAAAVSCATPTTADRPSTETGPQVHVAYVIPLDGDDRLVGIAPWIESQVSAIEAWWRREDPGRVPRFDRYAASCGPQLDVVTVRADRTERSLARLADIGSTIVDSVASAGLLGPHRTVMAWYDGPGGLPEVCGEGAGELDGEGIAILFTRACPGVPGELVAAHELVHALGALPAGAPHACPDDEGHPCDDPDDVIWPRATERPLDTVRLDAARDDYYRHRAAHDDIRDSSFLRRLDVRPTTIALAIAGAGVVTSDVPGLRCDASCDSVWDARLPVTLTAAPASGRRFVRWEGACTGRGRCVVDLAGGTIALEAVFAPRFLPLTIAVQGRGAVQGLRSGRRCASTCTLGVLSFAPVRLRAVPTAGWRLVRWEGACRGGASTCTVPMEKASRVRAIFGRRS